MASIDGPLDQRSKGAKLIQDNASIGTNIVGRATGKYMTGARTILRINKKIVGFAFGVEWNINTAQQEINTIDDYLPAEIAPQRIHVTGTISGLHIPGQSPTKEEYQANVLSFLAHQYIEIEVRDSQTDELLFHTSKAAISSRQESIQAGQMAKMTLQFVAIGWVDEMSPSNPKGIDTTTEGGASSAVGQLVASIFS